MRAASTRGDCPGSSATFYAFEIEGTGGTAGFSLVPQTTEAINILLANLALQLPVANRLTHDFTGRRIFAGVNGGLDGGDLLSRESDADFLDFGHEAYFTTSCYQLRDWKWMGWVGR